ncbi:MAG TPA: hypothetical protein VH158_03300 [Gemmatimonadales bacterium]|jgi:hypothetical protein|nr:hypothetical protein [Gemmatimonadales bacterium]
MDSIHCLECGGYVANMRRAEYRARSAGSRAAPRREQPCTCAKPILYMPEFHANERRAPAFPEREGVVGR